MRIDLDVPYNKKDKIKKLGAKWDAAQKTWYIENLSNIEPFLKYMKLRKELTKPRQ